MIVAKKEMATLTIGPETMNKALELWLNRQLGSSNKVKVGSVYPVNDGAEFAVEFTDGEGLKVEG